MTVSFPTPTEIKRHLRRRLPIYTDLFTSFLTVTSARVIPGALLEVTATDHGLSTGQRFVITQGETTNSVTAVVAEPSGGVRFTFSTQHDTTAPRQALDPTTALFRGFTNTAWNGPQRILSVPNRNDMVIAYPPGQATLPDITGAMLLETLAGFADAYSVNTIISDDVFTATTNSSFPALPEGPVENLQIILGFRIYAAGSIERAEAIYTKKNINAYTLFVIGGDRDASKDRNVEMDAVNAPTPQTRQLIDLITNFSCTVFIPTHGQVSGERAQSSAFGEVYESLLQSLFGASFGSRSAVNYVVAPNGHGQGIYNSAYYTEVYDWQIITTIDYTDGQQPVDSVAFRDIASTFSIFNDPDAEMILNINLDDET